jgi:hypothetical protein
MKYFVPLAFGLALCLFVHPALGVLWVIGHAVYVGLRKH